MEVIKEFQNYLENIRGYAANTSKCYGKDLKDFAEFIKREYEGAQWSTINEEVITDYIYMLKEKGLKPATINRHIESIRQLYNYFIRYGKITSNPARYISLQKIAKTIPNTINGKELEQAISKSTGTLRIMLILLARTGIRVQELLDITLQDIEDKDGRIRIHGKGNKERYVYLNNENMKELQNYCQGRPPRIFGEITQRMVRYALFNYLRQYSNAKQLSPHAIRHTYATNAARKGANITTLAKTMGHESIKTSQKYIDLGQSEDKEMMLRYSSYY